jgi:hypothetical protein
MLTIQIGQERNLPNPLQSFPFQLRDKDLITFEDFKTASDFCNKHSSELSAIDLEQIERKEPHIFPLNTTEN